MPDRIIPDVECNWLEVFSCPKNMFKVARLPEFAPMVFLAAISRFLLECRHKLDEIGGLCLAVDEEMDVIRHRVVSD